MKKAIVMGATSGIGFEVCKLMLNDGWTLGLAVRNVEKLKTLLAQSEIDCSSVKVCQIDVTSEESASRLENFIDEMGGIDLYFHVSGVGKENPELEPDIEMKTIETNALGFARLIGVAYRFFASHNGGHIAAVSSIAGTKGMGIAASYSATKAFDNYYIQSLEQLANMQHLKIRFTDIRPGFVTTELLDKNKKYFMQMTPKYAAMCIYSAIVNKKHIAVIDWKYCFLVALWRIVPNCIWRHLRVRNDR